MNETLRKTEPKGHDAWRTTSADGELGERAANVAQTILRRIRSSVNRFRGNLKPPSPPPEDIQLSHFDNIMRRVMTGGSIGKNPPVGETRSLSIRFEDRNLEPVGDGEVQLSGTAKISFSEHYDEDEAEVSVKIKYRFIEDDQLGSSCPIAVEPPDNFEESGDDSQEFVGSLAQGDEAKFNFLSDSYSSAWTARLIVNADIVEETDEDQ